MGKMPGSSLEKSKDAPAPRKDGKGLTVPGRVALAAKDDVCKSNLEQIRASISIAYSSSGDSAYPASLEETKLGNDFYKCPIGKEAYTYDPQTGQVHCPHKGHEGY